MGSKMRWLCLAALLPAVAAAQFTTGPQPQFDFGGGATSDKPWDSFHLNPKTRVKLDFHSGASWDSIISFFQNQTGVTIVKDPALTGTTSLTSARPVPLSDAFTILKTTLSLKGFNLEKQGNLLVIRSSGGGPGGNRGNQTSTFDPGAFQQPQDNSEVKVYKIEYANASALARVLNDVYTPNTNGNQFMQGGGRFFGGGGGPGGGAVQFRGGPGGGGGGNFQFNPGMFGRQQPNVRASSDDFSNSVIVNAPPAEQIQVSTLIKSLDLPSDLPLHTKVYHLVYASAQDTASIVQNVLTTNVPRGRSGATTSQTQGPQAFFNAIRGTTAGAGQVVPDLRTNSLVVTAADDDISIVDQVVTNLDHPVENQSNTFVFPLSNARAESVATVLQGAFGTRAGQQTGNQQTQINAQGSVGSFLNGSGGNNPVNRSPNQNTRSPGLQGNIMPDQGTEQYAMGYPSQDQQAAMVAKGQNYLPLMLQDPNAQSGELLTSIGVTQGFPGGGGGGGGIFRAAQGAGAGGQGSSASQATYGGSRNALGQLVNTIDPTGQITIIPDLNTNSVIVVGTPETVQIVKAMLAQLDKIPQQVEIQTVIVEATLDHTDKMGVEWKFAQSLSKLSHDPSAVGTVGQGFGVQSADTSSGIPGFLYTITSKNLSFYLSAISQDNNFNVLSTPRILTTNNVQAQINVSQQIPYVTSVQTDSAGNPTYSYSFLNVGVILTIQPRIMANGMVTLDVDQSANELEGYQNIGNTQAPVVNQREAQSTVSVKDGNTIILGGIIQKEVTATTNKVPLLGDIPILGNLFRSTSKTNTKTELLVFLSPHVVSNPADAKKLTDDTIKEMLPDNQKAIDKIRKQPGTTGPGTGNTGGGTGTGSGTGGTGTTGGGTGTGTTGGGTGGSGASGTGTGQ